MGRRILSSILTVYLPTVLLNVMGHVTVYFKPFFFEAIITVNLTVMLVLTTMWVALFVWSYFKNSIKKTPGLIPEKAQIHFRQVHQCVNVSA